METTITTIDFDNLPDLSKCQVDTTDLCSEYWTPSVGDFKRLFFVGFRTDKVQAIGDTSKTIDLNVVLFAEKTEQGNKAVTNGAARLVSTFANLQERGCLAIGDAFLITCLGEEKNKTNNFKSQKWSIKRIIH